MPSWKKVIVSGSDAGLNSLYVANSVTASIFSGSFTGSLFGTASQALTSSYVTGSDVYGPYGSNSIISASYAISALSASYAANVGFNYTASFVNQSTWNVNHNFNYRFIIVQAFDINYNEIIPANIELTDSNNATITFPTSESGHVIASVGGAAYFSTISASYASFAATASYFSGSISDAVSASYAATASFLPPVTNWYLTLSQVSQSLNFVDDAAAAAGGVPLGGIYRNGNFIFIRLT